MGWILAIIVGGFAGWIASKIMDADQNSILMNIILGILGSVVLNFLLSAIFAGGMSDGIFGRLIGGIIGACILIAGARVITGRK